MSQSPRQIQSRDNPLLQRVRRLVQDPVAYRKLGVCWLEGEHLASALGARAGRAEVALLAESAAHHPAVKVLSGCSDELVLVSDRCFAEFSSLPAQAAMGLLMPVPAPVGIAAGEASVVLDRVQDAGNVGSILRSAAALGITQVLALRGTAGLWSPKVLRAGMGAHFALRLLESQAADALDGLGLPLLATSSHGGELLPGAQWPEPSAWIFGHEGQGVDPALLLRCHSTLRIPQPGGEESLNVAAAAAICLYESMRRRNPA
jgi:RNA methyltransferase, TrmH family